jgi:hypothetical protein
MRPLSLAPILIALGLLAGCTEQPTEPGTSPPAFAILDGARGGNPEFYFLPPMVPAPSYSGTFDATQSPVVTICELAGTTCGTTVASFSGSAVKLDLTAEAYVAIWKTKDAGLDPTKTYRIQVLLGATVPGYADVVVLSNGSQIRTVDKNQFVSVINGGVLAIRFRIEAGAPPPPPCIPGAPGCGWEEGDAVSYNQINWGDPVSTAGVSLANNYDPVYFTTGGNLEVGLPSAAGFSMIFTDAGSVLAYNPSVGTVGPLNADLLNPTSSASGAYGGEVVALKLNVDFSDADVLGPMSIDFGSLLLCGFSAQPALNGMAIRDFLDVNHNALGGGPPLYPITDLFAITQELNGAFESGLPTLFAQTHVFNGACPGGWQNGDMTTHSQAQWGDGTTTAGNLLTNYFATVYFSTGGLLVGLVPTFNMTFDSPQAIFDYQPATGAAAPLNANLSNPTSTASGSFGGEVVALKLNVDFSQNNLLPSSANLRFGDLLICGVNPAIDGGNVSTFLGYANSALGGGAAPLSITELNSIAIQLNASFGEGAVSLFAQANLFNGPCP